MVQHLHHSRAGWRPFGTLEPVCLLSTLSATSPLSLVWKFPKSFHLKGRSCSRAYSTRASFDDSHPWNLFHHSHFQRVIGQWPVVLKMPVICRSTLDKRLGIGDNFRMNCTIVCIPARCPLPSVINYFTDISASFIDTNIFFNHHLLRRTGIEVLRMGHILHCCLPRPLSRSMWGRTEHEN